MLICSVSLLLRRLPPRYGSEPLEAIENFSEAPALISLGRKPSSSRVTADCAPALLLEVYERDLHFKDARDDCHHTTALAGLGIWRRRVA